MKAQIAFLTDTTSEVSLTSCKEAISIHEPGCMALQAKPLLKCNSRRSVHGIMLWKGTF